MFEKEGMPTPNTERARAWKGGHILAHQIKHTKHYISTYTVLGLPQQVRTTETMDSASCKDSSTAL